MCATVAADKKYNKGQRTTNNKRIAVAGKNSENEKEGTDVFCDVGDHGSTIKNK